jgi:very-short-patch-repair endonuclease
MDGVPKRSIVLRPRRGYRVVRVAAEVVLRDAEVALSAISAALRR